MSIEQLKINVDKIIEAYGSVLEDGIEDYA